MGLSAGVGLKRRRVRTLFVPRSGTKISAAKPRYAAFRRSRKAARAHAPVRVMPKQPALTLRGSKRQEKGYALYAYADSHRRFFKSSPMRQPPEGASVRRFAARSCQPPRRLPPRLSIPQQYLTLPLSPHPKRCCPRPGARQISASLKFAMRRLRRPSRTALCAVRRALRRELAVSAYIRRKSAHITFERKCVYAGTGKASVCTAWAGICACGKRGRAESVRGNVRAATKRSDRADALDFVKSGNETVCRAAEYRANGLKQLKYRIKAAVFRHRKLLFLHFVEMHEIYYTQSITRVSYT